MRDLDQLVTALREQADGLEPRVLLPGVRRGARQLRRRRQVAAMTAVILAVGGVVGGASLVGRSHGTRSAPAGPSTAATPSAVATAPTQPGLTGNTWYVVSWQVGGKRGLPATTRRPTLRFLPPNGTSGKSQVNVFDGGTTRSMTVVVSPGPQMVAWGAGFSAGSATAVGLREVDRVFAKVLVGNGGVELAPGQLTLTYLDNSITLVSTPPPVGAAMDVLLGKTWYLISVTRLGRTWTPDTTSTLIFHNTSVAETDDGENTEQWRVGLSPSVISWLPGEASTVGATIAANQVARGVSGVLAGTTAWSLSGSTLVLTGAAGGGLTYSTTAPPQPAPLGTVTVVLSATHVAGEITVGTSNVPGLITIFDPDGEELWSGQSPALTGTLAVPSGRYSAKATIVNGICAPAIVEVPAGEQVTLTLTCRDGLDTT